MPPNARQIIVIEDDEQCKAVLAYHNRLNALAPRSDCPRGFILFSDESMYYIAAHYYGYTDPTDNGYLVYIFPHVYFTKENMVQWWKVITQCDEPGHEPVFARYVEANPASN